MILFNDIIQILTLPEQTGLRQCAVEPEGVEGQWVGGFCRKFSFELIEGMIPRCDFGCCERERDDVAYTAVMPER
jgi:hypothetical protein